MFRRLHVRSGAVCSGRAYASELVASTTVKLYTLSSLICVGESRSRALCRRLHRQDAGSLREFVTDLQRCFLFGNVASTTRTLPNSPAPRCRASDHRVVLCSGRGARGVSRPRPTTSLPDAVGRYRLSGPFPIPKPEPHFCRRRPRPTTCGPFLVR